MSTNKIKCPFCQKKSNLEQLRLTGFIFNCSCYNFSIYMYNDDLGIDIIISLSDKRDMYKLCLQSNYKNSL